MAYPQDSLNFFTEVEVLDRSIRDGGRPVGFLLGAGASASITKSDGSPLIPAISGLTTTVRAALADLEADLVALDAMIRADGHSDPTVEDWLSRLRAMMPVMGVEGVRGLSSEAIVRLESSVTAAISEVLDVGLPQEPGGLGAFARWVGGSKRSHAVEIFTLNYDLLVESAFERAEVPYFDGFVGSVKPYLDVRSMEEETLPARWARFWKLHGSIDWTIEGGAVRRVSAVRDIEHAMIHPSHLKYDQSRKMPFLIMQDQFRRFLSTESATLIAAGYSFGDTHINAAIFDALQRNPSCVVFATLYGNLEDYSKMDPKLIACQNFRVLARDGGMLGGNRYTWDTTVEEQFSMPIGSIGDFAQLAAFLDRQAHR